MGRDEKTHECKVVEAIATFAGRWKGEIVWWIQDGPKRFGELRRAIPLVSAKVLTQQLRELEADRLVIRKQYAEIPARVEYSLTPLGKSVIPILDGIATWWRKNKTKVEKSRSACPDHS